MLNVDMIIGINKYICETTGNSSILINENGLYSAVGNTQWFDTIELQACALYRSIILNHPFRDGNKRTASLCLISIKAPHINQTEFEKITLEVAKGNLKDPVKLSELIYNL